MSDAPERICVTWPNPRGCGLAFTAESKKGAKCVRADRIAALEAEVARLREALTWYEPRLKRCNAFAPDGDRARDDLAKDGGKIARAALGDAKP